MFTFDFLDDLGGTPAKYLSLRVTSQQLARRIRDKLEAIPIQELRKERLLSFSESVVSQPKTPLFGDSEAGGSLDHSSTRPAEPVFLRDPLTPLPIRPPCLTAPQLVLPRIEPDRAISSPEETEISASLGVALDLFRKRLSQKRAAVNLFSNRKVYLFLEHGWLRRALQHVLFVFSILKLATMDLKDPRAILQALFLLWLFTHYLSGYQPLALCFLLLVTSIYLLVLQWGIPKMAKRKIRFGHQQLDPDASFETVRSCFAKVSRQFGFCGASNLRCLRKHSTFYDQLTCQRGHSLWVVWTRNDIEAFAHFKVTNTEISFELYGVLRIPDFLLLNGLFNRISKRLESVPLARLAVPSDDPVDVSDPRGASASTSERMGGLLRHHFSAKSRLVTDGGRKTPESERLDAIMETKGFSFPGPQPPVEHGSNPETVVRRVVAKERISPFKDGQHPPREASKDQSSSGESENPESEAISPATVFEIHGKEVQVSGTPNDPRKSADRRPTDTPFESRVSFREDLERPSTELVSDLTRNRAHGRPEAVSQIDAVFDKKMVVFGKVLEWSATAKPDESVPNSHLIFGMSDPQFITKVCRTILPFPPETLFNFLLNPAQVRFYNPLLEHLSVVERYDDTHFLMHMVIKTPVFVANRDFSLLLVGRRASPDCFYIFNFSVDSPKVPLVKKNVRGELSRRH